MKVIASTIVGAAALATSTDALQLKTVYPAKPIGILKGYDTPFTRTKPARGASLREQLGRKAVERAQGDAMWEAVAAKPLSPLEKKLHADAIAAQEVEKANHAITKQLRLTYTPPANPPQSDDTLKKYLKLLAKNGLTAEEANEKVMDLWSADDENLSSRLQKLLGDEEIIKAFTRKVKKAFTQQVMGEIADMGVVPALATELTGKALDDRSVASLLLAGKRPHSSLGSPVSQVDTAADMNAYRAPLGRAATVPSMSYIQN